MDARPASGRPTSRWPPGGAGQKPLLLAALLAIVGTFLPWVYTAAGATFTGVHVGSGITFYMGIVGVAGALVPSRRLALAHALLFGAVAAALPAWQLLRVAQLSAATGAWGTLLPGPGLFLVLAGGALALRAAGRLRAQA